MNDRIQQFERVWNNRTRLPRLMVFDDLPRPPLVRCTNEHHRLSPRSLEVWWGASNEVRAELLSELSPIPLLGLPD